MTDQRHHSSLGIVLRRERHSEGDVRLSLFLKDGGKMMIRAKGGLTLTSKLRPLQEPFTEADFHVYLPNDGIYGRLLGGQLKTSHQPIRQNYEAFQIASRCCEVVELLVPYRAPTPEVFDILQLSLHSISNSPTPKHHWIPFLAQLLKTLGHGDFSDASPSVIEQELEQHLPRPLKSAVAEI